MTKSQTLAFTIGGLAFVVYTTTLAPTITWRNDGVDSGDLAAAVAVGGVPHPSGYPTYLLLGGIFKQLPFGDVAYRLNLLSATSAALAVALVGVIIYQTLSAAAYRQPTQKKETAGERKGLICFCAASASLVLAFSRAFWSQAVIAEVYALNAFFVAFLLYVALQVQVTNQPWSIPLLFGLLGLSLGNHVTIILLLPMILLTLKARWRMQQLVAAFLAFCFGLSVYLAIPIRAASSPPINWGVATTWSNFLWLVSAGPYRQFLFAVPWPLVPTRVVAELQLLSESFLWWGVPVGLLGLSSLLRLKRTLAYSSLVTLLLFSGYAIGYNTTDSYVYLLPGLLIFSMWIGWGFYDLGQMLQKVVTSKLKFGYFINWGLIVFPVVSLLLNFSQQNLSQKDEALLFAQHSLHLVAHDAVIITDDDPKTFALWYGRYGLNLRPDVAIVNSNLLTYDWYRQTLRKTHANLLVADQTGRPLTDLTTFVESNFSGSPLYLATHQARPLRGYRLESVDTLQRVVELANE